MEIRRQKLSFLACNLGESSKQLSEIMRVPGVYKLNAQRAIVYPNVMFTEWWVMRQFKYGGGTGFHE